MAVDVVMATDVVFAADSIPANFAITTSAFAVLGLHPLYFMIYRFVYLQAGPWVGLVFVGAKFMISDPFGKVPIRVYLPRGGRLDPAFL